MHRKVQVFSMPGKVSIGQDRNKKDPHRGRKLTNGIVLSVKKIHIEIKKIPIGDGNTVSFVFMCQILPHRNKKDPHRGRKLTMGSFSLRILNRNKKDPHRGRKHQFQSP